MSDDIAKQLAEATGFEWDTGNAPKVVSRHQVAPGECEQAFFQEPFVVSYDATHSTSEPRWRALGQTLAGRLLFLVFTVRGSLIRVLAARGMNRKERRYYAEITARAEEGPELQIGSRGARVLEARGQYRICRLDSRHSRPIPEPSALVDRDFGTIAGYLADGTQAVGERA